MSTQSRSRRTYEQSCRELQRLGLIDQDAIPPLPPRQPRFDDESLGVNFFRTAVSGVDLSDMTLPRTFFGRSEISDCSFRNTDLSESTLCWNDFLDVDFTEGRLIASDLRAAIFVRANFSRSDLRNADLRQSTLEDCDFTDAQMLGTKFTCEQGSLLILSAQQIESINWQDDDGDEPDGG